MNKKILFGVVIVAVSVAALTAYFLAQRIFTPSAGVTSIITPSAPTTTGPIAKLKNPTISNANNDFHGTNLGGSIHFTWSPAIKGVEFVIFKSDSLHGPWIEHGRLPWSAGREGVDITDDTFIKTLCYRLEARDSAGRTVQTYDPICVPPYE